MVQYMKDRFLMEKDMEKEFIHGKMEQNMKDPSKMINFMDQEL